MSEVQQVMRRTDGNRLTTVSRHCQAQRTVAGSSSGETRDWTADGPGRVATRAGTSTCTTTSGEPACVMEGPTTVEVEVRAGVEPVDAVVDVSRQHVAPPAWAGCLVGPFPNDAVIVKADYRRRDFSLGMPVYDTSADALGSASSFTRVPGAWGVSRFSSRSGQAPMSSPPHPGPTKRKFGNSAQTSS